MADNTKIEIISSIENGTIKRNRKLFVDILKRFEGKEIKLTIQMNFRKRTNQENAYYWGCIIPIMQTCYYQAGYLWDKDRTHEALRFRFLKTERVNKLTGEMFEDILSTTELSTVDAEYYYQQIRDFALDYFNAIIPEPDTEYYLKKNN